MIEPITQRFNSNLTGVMLTPPQNPSQSFSPLANKTKIETG